MGDSDQAPVALVTGARKGIGRFLCEHLLGNGYQVVGCSRKAADWQADGFCHLEIDVTNENQVQDLFRHIRRHNGRLDVVINNAGFASMNHTFLTPMSTVGKTFGTNVGGSFLVSREAAKLMRKRKFGRIVSVSSAVVQMRTAGEAVYLASKRALECLTQVMAKEFAEYGITVNVVGPGPTQTDMIRGVPKAKLDDLLSGIPMRTLTTLDDIANVVDFFIRPESKAVTGQVVYLGGVPNG